MRFRARFADGASGRLRSIDIGDIAGIAADSRPVKAELDGVARTFDARATSAGGFSIVAADGRHAEATPWREPDGTLRVSVGSHILAFEFLDELSARALQAAGPRSRGRGGDLKASLPGRILRVLVEPGAAVTAGQPLIVIEAMKMENEIRSPRDGKVRSVDVAPGQAVGVGDVMVRFEAEG